jgi:uncharacterized protein (DUF58 family)
MDAPQEFHYRLPGRIGGQRPGSHRGSSVGAGQEFVTHLSLYDRPDPRRLDLRASIRTLRDDDWLVRVNRQRTGTGVRAIVDVSASMCFGSRRSKLHVVADFVEALGMSAFRVGDAVGMMAFDDSDRPDLFTPARLSRGMGSIMASSLRAACDARLHAGVRAPQGSPANAARRTPHNAQLPGDGLEDAAARLAGQQGLVFLVSDFHWPLQRLDAVLDPMAHAGVVPVVVWDPAETEPPSRNSLASLSDSETGARRTLWIRPRLRDQWRLGVERRRAEIDSFFATHALRPFYMQGAFDADALSRYFFEADA